jgi:YHS domain-containing protein
MIRSLLVFVAVVIIYYALKAVVTSALRSYHAEGARSRIKGEEMVLDPQCRTYVIKGRAVTRRIGGSIHSFCSEECARRYEEAHRA